MGNPENTEKEIITEKSLRSDNKKKPVNDNRQFSRSPEKLTEYIRIGSPGGIIFIIALALVAAALITWGLAGKIPVTASIQGVVDGDNKDSRYITSFVDINSSIAGVPEGSDVNIVTKDGKQFKGKTLPLGKNPLSSKELRQMYGEDNDWDTSYPEYTQWFYSDWLLDTMLEDDGYYYIFMVETQDNLKDYFHQIADLTFTLKEVRPYSFLTN